MNPRRFILPPAFVVSFLFVLAAMFRLAIAAEPGKHAGNMPPQANTGATPCQYNSINLAVTFDAFTKSEQPPKQQHDPVRADQMKNVAAYSQAVERQKREDWGGLCIYRADDRVSAGAIAVFLGDSITFLWQYAEPSSFPPRVLDRGITGQVTGQILLRFQQDVIDLHPKIVHLLAGTNDMLASPTDLPAAEDSLKSMLDLAAAHGILAVIGTIPPADKFGLKPGMEQDTDSLNQWIRETARVRHVALADYAKVLSDSTGHFAPKLTMDGIHPNLRGFQAMRAVLTSALAAHGISLPSQ